MNRKGQGGFDWSLESIGKLIIAAVVIIAIIYMSVKLVGLFLDGNADFGAQRNFDILSGRIEDVREHHLLPPEASVVLAVPSERAIISFDAGQESIAFEPGTWYDPRDALRTNPRIMRPSECNTMLGKPQDACLCVVRVKVETKDKGPRLPKVYEEAVIGIDVVSCERYDAKTISGTIKDTQVDLTGLNLNIHNLPKATSPWSQTVYPVFISGIEGKPYLALIYEKNGHILIAENAGKSANVFGGGDSGGGGASSSWADKCPLSVTPWAGADPYVSTDSWAGTKPELKLAYEAFNKAQSEKTGRQISQKIISTWRPQEYQDHIRSTWDAWRLANGKSFTIKDASCPDNGKTITPPAGWQNCNALLASLKAEVEKHQLAGDTRPACTSDHVKGIAFDIEPPVYYGSEYEAWIQTGVSLPGDLQLCHYIAGDEPHFGLKKYLPAGISCSVP